MRETPYRTYRSKVFAAHLLLRFFNNKYLIDKRLLQRFKVWQDSYLNFAISTYIDKRHHKILSNLKQATFKRLNTRIILTLKKSFLEWKKNMSLIVMNSITE